MPPSIAASMSASSKTMKGALPPSSSDTFLTVPAHCSMRSLPTSVDPVKLSLRTPGLAVSSRPTSPDGPVTTFKTPFGMPARSASTANASAERGVDEAGRITTGQPAASAGAHFRVIIAAGKFHGVIDATTPMGCLMTTMRWPGSGSSMTSP
jgi:hypothetical protein